MAAVIEVVTSSEAVPELDANGSEEMAAETLANAVMEGRMDSLLTSSVNLVDEDGHRYRLRFRTDDGYDGVAYQASFDTVTDNWRVIHVRFSDCMPTFRGRRVSNAPSLDGRLIQQIGFMIADKQEGPFRLEIDWVKAYKGVQ